MLPNGKRLDFPMMNDPLGELEYEDLLDDNHGMDDIDDVDASNV